MMVEVDAMSRYNRVYDQWLSEQKAQSIDAGLLSRYNRRAEELRQANDSAAEKRSQQEASRKEPKTKGKPGIRNAAKALLTATRNLPPVDCTLLAPEVRGGKNCERTELAEAVDRNRNVWILGLPMTVEAAMVDIGMDLALVQKIAFTGPVAFGQVKNKSVLMVDKAIEFLKEEPKLQVDWLFILPTSKKEDEIDQALQLVSMAVLRPMIKAICVFDATVGIHNEIDDLLSENRHWVKFQDVLSNRTCGGFIQDERRVMVLLPKAQTKYWKGVPKETASTVMALSEILDDDLLPLKFQPKIFGNTELLPQERDDFVSFQADQVKPTPTTGESYLARELMTGKLCTEANGVQEAVVYDVRFPAPADNSSFLISAGSLYTSSEKLLI